MPNLQKITLTVDELTPAGTLLHPADGYDAIESVTFKGLWDYWNYASIEWGEVESVNHGVLHLDPYYFINEAHPELSGNWTESDSEFFLTPDSFNTMLRSKNSYHSSVRCGNLTFRSFSMDFTNYDSGNSEYLPEMYWRLIEAAPARQSRSILNQFNQTSLTLQNISQGVLLKFLGTAYPGDLSFGANGSYYAYFVNTASDPCCFYLLGLEATARGRMDPTTGDYVDSNVSSIVNTISASEWWGSVYDIMMYVKYLDKEISY